MFKKLLILALLLISSSVFADTSSKIDFVKSFYEVYLSEDENHSEKEMRYYGLELKKAIVDASIMYDKLGHEQCDYAVDYIMQSQDWDTTPEDIQYSALPDGKIRVTFKPFQDPSISTNITQLDFEVIKNRYDEYIIKDISNGHSTYIESLNSICE